MANDLTGQNIQDTYQRVLHVGDDGLMYNGTGSLYTPLSASHEITTELSSSYAETASYATNFTASGNISASGGIYGDSITGPTDNNGLTISAVQGVQLGNADSTFGVIRSVLAVKGDLTVDTHISMSGNLGMLDGNITTDGDITANTIEASSIKGTIDGGEF